MRFEHRFHVDAPVEAVAAFHRRPDALRRLTPPPGFVRYHATPAAPSDGGRLPMTLWLGPLPVRWTAVFRDVRPEGFVDEQESGPFASWRHEHRYHPAAGGGTLVEDRIELRLRRNPAWAALGLALWASLPLTFRYRAWRTRRLLRSTTP